MPQVQPTSGGYPFTLAQYQALVKAYATGVTRVTVEGRTTEYRSGDDLMRALMRVQAELQAAGLLPAPTPQPAARYRYITVKGLW